MLTRAERRAPTPSSSSRWTFAGTVSRLEAAEGRETADARIVLASRVEREWLVTTTSEVVHRFDEATGGVRAVRVERYDALVLAEHPAQTDPAVAARLLAAHWLERGPADADGELLRRLRFAELDVDVKGARRNGGMDARSACRTSRLRPRFLVRFESRSIATRLKRSTCRAAVPCGSSTATMGPCRRQ